MHFFKWKYSEIEQLPITIYREAREQAINIANLKMGGRFGMMSYSDKQKEAKANIARLRAEGKLK